MCGIAGIIDFSDRPVSVDRIVRMSSTQRHRGPDGEGIVVFHSDGETSLYNDPGPGGVRPEGAPLTGALAHQRLAIIDLSKRAAQPMNDPSGRYWVTYNGEIYNYIELRTRLKGKGYSFRSDSDTEVLLHAYREWGKDCLEYLNGMFSFAVWDTEEQSMFAARDRLGIKPFYYWYRPGEFLFSSEQKAIISVLDNRPVPNLDAVSDYLTFSFIPSDQTMVQGISKLEPGCYLNVDASGIRVQRYWDPEFDPAPDFNERSAVDELRFLLDDSVRMQIRSDVPIGAHLSGGIDSSAVCCLAAGHLPRLTTFTARFSEGGFYDETPYARVVSERIGSDYREIVPAGERLTELLPKIIYHLDEPVEAASVFGKYHVAEIVSDSVKVVLGGQGGDELFGGYDWYVKSLFTALCYGAEQPLAGHSRAGFIRTALAKEGGKRFAKSLWKNTGTRRLDRTFCANWSRFPERKLSRVFNQGVRSEFGSPARRFLESFGSLGEHRDVDRMFKFDLRHYLQALLTSEDRLSMAFSVESRVPLLDHRIAELAGRIGAERKIVPGHSKDLLRKALSGIVPEQILQRTDKRGFPTPIAKWLRDPDLALMDRFVFSGNRFARKYFDIDYLRSLEKQRSWGSTDASERLWRVLNVCVWGEVFGLV